MIRAVLDTNVLASGLANAHGPSGRLLLAWENDEFTLCLSDPLLRELAVTLTIPYFAIRVSAEQAARALGLFRTRAQVVEPIAGVSGVATHPEDDLILATAAASAVSHLVTGDKALQGLHTYEGVQIVAPRTFLEYLEEARDLTKGGEDV